MIKAFFSFLFLAALVSLSSAGSLDEYVQQGLASNLALKQKAFSLQQSIQSLKQARGLFMPQIAINARYSRAGGGREIEFPVGDLLNPAYASINQLLQSSGQPPRPFPLLDNEIIPFLREEEQETKIQLLQPVFQPRIYYNYKIQSGLRDIKEIETRMYTRQLVFDIKRSYYQYLQTEKLLQLFRSTTAVLQENLRVNEKLFSAQKVTRDAVYRAQAELSAVNQRQLEAQNQHSVARSYFNFLLNRPLVTTILSDESVKKVDPFLPDSVDAEQMAIQNREELQQLDKAIYISDQKSGLVRAAYMPAITGVFDYGIQGEDYDFSSDSDYWMGSLLLQWNLFNGFQDQARLEQSKLEAREIAARREESVQQIRLQVNRNRDHLLTAYKKTETAKLQLTSARASFEIIDKKYRQGMISQMEYLDARNTLTNAEINEILIKYDFLIARAEFERVTASYPLGGNNSDD